MNVTVTSKYTSVACNRTPAIVDWNNEGIICYGATNAVVLYDTNIKRENALTVLCHHKARVNSVKWLKNSHGASGEFLSCSNDKTGALWSHVDGAWNATSLAGHTEGTTCIDGVYSNQHDVIIYTASIDSTVKIWKRINGEVSCHQTICLSSGLCLTLRAHLLPHVQQPIVFCALDDHKIHIFASTNAKDTEHHRLHVLAGHEDWVRGLDAINVDNNAILLASCSQDTYIRLWRIQLHDPDEVASNTIKIEEKLFMAYDRDWSVKLDAVLAGHEGWVYGVHWHPPAIDPETKTLTPVHRLLSSSLDKTMIIWEPDANADRKSAEDTGVWVECVRVGDVGGNGLGFYGSKFGPNGKSFIGHGYNGSFHMWILDEETSAWSATASCGGHSGAVVAGRWEPRGRYLATASADQTTRVHAPWRSRERWHELARPQVHGYDMSSLTLVSSTTLVSAAEEKVIRVFEAPHNFIQNFKNITGEDLVTGPYSSNGPEGASVPSLGLSNKAVQSGDPGDNDGYFVPVHLTEPPTEETLVQNTLWPETHKLYGHGYEVQCVAATPGPPGALASACRASSAAHAAIIIWETERWQQVQKVECHQLTVTAMSFSPDGERLVSVSRDRSWALLRRERGAYYTLEARGGRGVHARVLWCCAWTPDGAAFVTGSRDGKVCLWSEQSLNEYSPHGSPLSVTGEAVTAVDVAPWSPAGQGTRLLAIGLDSGRVRLYSFLHSADKCWTLLHEMDNSAAHHLTVKMLSFKPLPDQSEEGEHPGNQITLASGGSDNLVRIYELTVQL